VRQLEGSVVIRTDPGKGAVFEITVPMSIASMDALLVEGGGRAAIPADAVRRTLRIASEDIMRSAGREEIHVDGRLVPLIWLSRLLAPGDERARAGPRSVVLVEGRMGCAACAVDALVGTARIVVRPLPAFTPAAAAIAGAALDAEGNPQLVLDPDGLVASAHNAAAPAPEAVKAARPILIVDDSLTTRMLEKSILESAGYEVEVAGSAEEGLDKAARSAYALFLVDVEMPGMNGFEFIEHTQRDPHLRDTPAILVTSRMAPEDRRRGVEAGARGYIVKSEFNQNELLQRIRELSG
jgi:two-component system chemotaxis sensor kinase CheA